VSAEHAHKDGTGVLFENRAKWIAEKPSRPALGGEATISGKRWRVAGWFKKTDAGNEFISLAFSEPQDKAQPPAQKGGAQ
jgi:hypothetical protein